MQLSLCRVPEPRDFLNPDWKFKHKTILAR
jgi:hypothetical protein